ncbi:MAG: hypothetical protein KDC26_05450 [Armatimonadetes bacterium]|nr:hypothetical protein [Armatimonadota bacterium]
MTTSRFQSYIIDRTKNAANEFFRYAKAIPANKLDFSVGGDARTPLLIIQEVAMCPGWAAELIDDRPVEWSEESMAAEFAYSSGLTTVEMCEAEFNKRMEDFEKVVSSFPDDRLMNTKFLPFEGGRDFTYQEMMDYPRWNLNYHTGQIALIQMAYGDKEMY